MFENFCQSVVIVDGKRQDYHTPGRIVDFHDEPLATFIVGDAKYSWDWTWENGIAGHGWNFTPAEVAAGEIQKHLAPGFELDPHCAADFHYTFRNDPVERIPLALSPTWLGPAGIVNPVARKENYPVKEAFRTAGLVRGAHPYLIVADDIRKDDSVHHYDWILQLDPDLTMTLPGSQRAADGIFDIVLRSDGSTVSKPNDESPPDPRPQSELLVRVLDRNQDSAHPLEGANAFISDIKAGTWKRGIHRLIIPSDSVSPGYKVLIFPHPPAEPVPATRWNAERNSLAVTWPDQEDQITFTPSASGKTDITVTRRTPKRALLVAVDKAIEPLVEKSPSSSAVKW